MARGAARSSTARENSLVTSHPVAGLDAGMRALLARRADALTTGARSVGWKIGFNAPGLQVHFGLDGPVVGYLTDSTVHEPGAPVEISRWVRPALEVEVAVRVGEDGGVAGLGPALELVDLDRGFDDLELILAGNVFHRGVIFGDEVPGVEGDLTGPMGLEVEVRRTKESLATGRLAERPEVTVEVVRAFLNAHGAALEPGRPHHRRFHDRPPRRRAR